MSRFRSFALGGFATLFFLLCPFSASAQNSTAPVILNVSSTVSGISAQFTWVATDEDTIAGVSFSYGPTLQYGLTSSVKYSYVFASSGLKYFFSTSVNNLTPGVENFYKIAVIDINSVSTIFTGSISTKAADLTPPVISRVAVAAQSGSATISWETDKSSNSRVSYFRTGAAPIVKVVEGLTTRHYVYLGGLVPGSTYYYTISSADSAGNVSALFDSSFKTIAELAPPTDVGNFNIKVMDSYLRLSWSNPIDVRFERVAVVKKIGDAPNSPADGVTVYSGKEQVFSDYSVHSGNRYFYTVYSVNNLGNYSGGTTREVMFGKMSGSEMLPVATVPSSKKIRAEDLKFFSSDHQVEIPLVEGVVTSTPGSNFSIHLFPSLLAYVPAKTVLNLGGQAHNSYFEHDAYHFDFVFHEGYNKAYIKIDYVNGLIDVISFELDGVGASISKPIVSVPVPVVETPAPVIKVAEPPPAPQSIIKDFQDTAVAVSDLTKNEEVKNAITQVVAPTIVGVTAFSTISLVSFANFFPFFQLLLIEPLIFLGRRRRGGSGQVYNAQDKTPLALATVRLLNKDTGKVVQSRVTDENGHYTFVVNPGHYALQAFKRDFSFPSLTLLGFKDDGQRMNIYHGDTITVAESAVAISENIPLDPIGGERRKPKRLYWKSKLSTLRSVLYWVGFPILLLSLYISPKWYTWVMIVVHPAMLALSYRLSVVRSKVKNWGTVTDKKTNLPINQAMVRLYNAKYDKMVSSQVTDNRGRYFMIAGDNEYYVTAEKVGYVQSKTAMIDLKGKENQNITIDIALEKS